MTRALVLGGGGPVGIAWQIGLVAGLAETGVDLARADRIVGTSAGSVVGALLASGRKPDVLYADHLALAQRTAKSQSGSRQPAPDLGKLVEFMVRRPAEGPAPASLMAQVGAYALQAKTIPEADYLAMMGRLFGFDGRWPRNFACTAADAETGAFRTWEEEDGIDATLAVASSCAVPGLYPPVTIGGRRYVDGGIRSTTNADLASGFDEVVLVAVTLKAFAPTMAAAADRELAPMRAAGGRTTLVVPDDRALAVFGPNLMETGRRAEIAEAGREQGRAEAARLSEWR